jgi:hypothetical protein
VGSWWAREDLNLGPLVLIRILRRCMVIRSQMNSAWLVLGGAAIGIGSHFLFR